MGKTQGLEQICADYREIIKDEFPLFIFHTSTNSPTDMRGLGFADRQADGTATRAIWLPYGNMYELTQINKPCYALFDDFGQTPESVQKSCMQLFGQKELNGMKIKEHVTMGVATNTTSDFSGVLAVLHAIKERWDTIVELEYEMDDHIEWLWKQTAAVETIYYIKFQGANLIREAKPTKDFVNIPSPRTVFKLDRWVKRWPEIMGMFAGQKHQEEKANSFLTEIGEGIVGKGYITAFMNFRRIYMHLPNLDDIVANPTTHPVPQETDIRIALEGALVNKASMKNFDNIYLYLKRLDADECTAVMMDMGQVKPELKKTKSFIEWAVKNANYLID
jgi:hypothetical protein